jgi:hypothetical protein
MFIATASHSPLECRVRKTTSDKKKPFVTSRLPEDLLLALDNVFLVQLLLPFDPSQRKMTKSGLVPVNQTQLFLCVRKYSDSKPEAPLFWGSAGAPKIMTSGVLKRKFLVIKISAPETSG